MYFFIKDIIYVNFDRAVRLFERVSKEGVVDLEETTITKGRIHALMYPFLVNINLSNGN